MSGWLASKFKAAEKLLNKIDQSAAQTLRIEEQQSIKSTKSKASSHVSEDKKTKLEDENIISSPKTYGKDVLRSKISQKKPLSREASLPNSALDISNDDWAEILGQADLPATLVATKAETSTPISRAHKQNEVLRSNGLDVDKKTRSDVSQPSARVSAVNGKKAIAKKLPPSSTSKPGVVGAAKSKSTAETLSAARNFRREIQSGRQVEPARDRVPATVTGPVVSPEWPQPMLHDERTSEPVAEDEANASKIVTIEQTTEEISHTDLNQDTESEEASKPLVTDSDSSPSQLEEGLQPSLTDSEIATSIISDQSFENVLPEAPPMVVPEVAESKLHSDESESSTSSNLSAPVNSAEEQETKNETASSQLDQSNDLLEILLEDMVTNTGKAKEGSVVVKAIQPESVAKPEIPSEKFSTPVKTPLRQSASVSSAEHGSSSRALFDLVSGGSIANLPMNADLSDSSSDSDSDSESDGGEKREAMERMAAIEAEVERANAMAAKLAREQFSVETVKEALKDRCILVEKLEKEKMAVIEAGNSACAGQDKEIAGFRAELVRLMDEMGSERKREVEIMAGRQQREAELELENAVAVKELALGQRELEEVMAAHAAVKEEAEELDMAVAVVERQCRAVLAQMAAMAAEAGRRGEEADAAVVTSVTESLEGLRIKVEVLEEELMRTRTDSQLPSDMELELEQRLESMVDMLIQQQSMVECLASEKAAIALRLEAAGSALREARSGAGARRKNPVGGRESSASMAEDEEDMEVGLSRAYALNRIRKQSVLEADFGYGGKVNVFLTNMADLAWSLDSLVIGGASYIRTNSTIRRAVWMYLLFLHLWVLFVWVMHSSAPPLIEPHLA